MKQFGTIFQFELISYFKNKVFVGVTVFLVVVIAAVMFFPNIMDIIGGEKTEVAEEAGYSGSGDTADGAAHERIGKFRE